VSYLTKHPVARGSRFCQGLFIFLEGLAREGSFTAKKDKEGEKGQ
jgi:hypothetical protein